MNECTYTYIYMKGTKNSGGSLDTRTLVNRFTQFRVIASVCAAAAAVVAICFFWGRAQPRSSYSGECVYTRCVWYILYIIPV